MINKTSISISTKVADLLTSLVGNTLSEELYETVFDFYRDLLRGYDSETINEIQEQLKGVIW